MQEKQEALYDDLQQENLYLKEKCNKQVDALFECKNTVQSQQEEINRLNDYIKSINQGGNVFNNDYDYFFRVYYEVIKNILKDGAIIETKSNTVNARLYHYVDLNLFYEYIGAVAGEDYRKKFLNNCLIFNLLKSDENNKSNKIAFPFRYDKKNIRVVRIEKTIINYIRECLLYD